MADDSTTDPITLLAQQAIEAQIAAGVNPLDPNSAAAPAANAALASPDGVYGLSNPLAASIVGGNPTAQVAGVGPQAGAALAGQLAGQPGGASTQDVSNFLASIGPQPGPGYRQAQNAYTMANMPYAAYGGPRQFARDKAIQDHLRQGTSFFGGLMKGLPLITSLIAPGLGGVLGGALGIGSKLGSALISGLGGAASGGYFGGPQGALLGGLGGGGGSLLGSGLGSLLRGAGGLGGGGGVGSLIGSDAGDIVDAAGNALGSTAATTLSPLEVIGSLGGNSLGSLGGGLGGALGGTAGSFFGGGGSDIAGAGSEFKDTIDTSKLGGDLGQNPQTGTPASADTGNTVSPLTVTANPANLNGQFGTPFLSNVPGLNTAGPQAPQTSASDPQNSKDIRDFIKKVIGDTGGPGLPPNMFGFPGGIPSQPSEPGRPSISGPGGPSPVTGPGGGGPSPTSNTSPGTPGGSGQRTGAGASFGGGFGGGGAAPGGAGVDIKGSLAPQIYPWGTETL